MKWLFATVLVQIFADVIGAPSPGDHWRISNSVAQAQLKASSFAFAPVGSTWGATMLKRAGVTGTCRQGGEMRRAIPQVVTQSESRGQQHGLLLRASTSSGLPPDPNLDDATLWAAMEAADQVEAAVSKAAAAEAAAAYASKFNANVVGLPADSQFRVAEGTDVLGMMDNAEADDIIADSGVQGQVVRVALAICRATRLTPGPALPSVDNIFEYLVVLQDREGEEWLMGSVWDLPQCEVQAGEDMDALVVDLLANIGLDEDTFAVYPDYFACPIYMPSKEDTTLSLDAQREGKSEETSSAKSLKEQAEFFVMVDNKHKIDTGGRAAVKWLDTKDIVKGFQNASEAGDSSANLDGTFMVAGNRVADDIVGVLARMEKIREMQEMNILVDIKTCRERFRFIQIMKELYEERGFEPGLLPSKESLTDVKEI